MDKTIIATLAIGAVTIGSCFTKAVYGLAFNKGKSVGETIGWFEGAKDTQAFNNRRMESSDWCDKYVDSLLESLRQ